jgi:hypothetical protein
MRSLIGGWAVSVAFGAILVACDVYLLAKGLWWQALVASGGLAIYVVALGAALVRDRVRAQER